MTTTPTAAARVSGTIKALEWRNMPDDPQGYTWRARKPFGSSYYIHENGEGLFAWRDCYGSLNAAKAAAQADYDARIIAEIQPDPEPQPVAWQFRAMENGQPRTGWHMAGTNDHASWVELARTDATCSIEDRPLFATPSSAGTVSVEAAALENVLRRGRNITASMRIARTSIGDNADHGHLEAVALRYVRWQDLAFLDAALRALAGEGER